jgi:hypothetical protein
MQSTDNFYFIVIVFITVTLLCTSIHVGASFTTQSAKDAYFHVLAIFIIVSKRSYIFCAATVIW